MSELITNINDTVDISSVITVPIDDSLSVSGEAADAKAVGDALALKADKSELAQAITVNGQGADLQGAILVDGTDIPVSEANATTIAAAIAAQAARTGADIPLNAETGSVSIEQAIAGVEGNSASIADNVMALGGEITDSSYNVQGIRIGTTTLPVKDTAAVTSVNNLLPSSSGNVSLTTVEVARQLQSDSAQLSEGTFIDRTSGGAASIADGEAWLGVVRGHSVHEGYVAPSFTSECSNEEVTITVDEETFKTSAGTGGTYVFTYTSGAWDTDPAGYGITYTGTLASGDTITVVWVEEVRGTITVATPESFCSTGWNLYNNTVGYARVLKYSDTYGFKVSGAYTALQYSATLNGARVNVTPVDGAFSITGDGYIFVTGGNSTTTAIWMTHSDWQEGYNDGGAFEAYTESAVDLSGVMSERFTNGLCAVGEVYDEININIGQAIQRIEVLEYDPQTIADLDDAGRAYEYDENYIYAVLTEEVTNSISVDGAYTVDDHGMEFWRGTEVACYAQSLYGENLVDKLRTDVLTKSAQTLSSTEQAQARTNIGAASQADMTSLNDSLANLMVRKSYSYSYSDLAAGASLAITGNQLGLSRPDGYYPVGIYNLSTGSAYVALAGYNLLATTGAALTIVNNSSASRSGSVTFGVIYVNMSNVPIVS